MGSFKEIICITCGKKAKQLIHKRSSYLYCSNQCQQIKQMLKSVENKTASHKTLRRYLLFKYGEKCWNCGITEWNNKKIQFELEHIDGNSMNQELYNLSILCPNCHSQTDTYKSKNRGNGRSSRRKKQSAVEAY